MKKLFILFCIMTFGLAISQVTDCEEIKKENTFLKEKLKQYGISTEKTETSVESFNQNLRVNFIRAEGSIKNQTVTIFFSMSNPNLANQRFHLKTDGSVQKNFVMTKAYNEIGEGFEPISASIGAQKSIKFNSSGFGKTLVEKINTGNQPIFISITFSGIIPDKTPKLGRADIIMDTYDFNLGDMYDSKNIGITTISNIDIVWK